MSDCIHMWKVSKWNINKDTFKFDPDYECMKCGTIKE